MANGSFDVLTRCCAVMPRVVLGNYTSETCVMASILSRTSRVCYKVMNSEEFFKGFVQLISSTFSHFFLPSASLSIQAIYNDARRQFLLKTDIFDREYGALIAFQEKAEVIATSPHLLSYELDQDSVPVKITIPETNAFTREDVCSASVSEKFLALHRLGGVVIHICEVDSKRYLATYQVDRPILQTTIENDHLYVLVGDDSYHRDSLWVFDLSQKESKTPVIIDLPGMASYFEKFSGSIAVNKNCLMRIVKYDSWSDLYALYALPLVYLEHNSQTKLPWVACEQGRGRSYIMAKEDAFMEVVLKEDGRLDISEIHIAGKTVLRTKLVCDLAIIPYGVYVLDHVCIHNNRVIMVYQIGIASTQFTVYDMQLKSGFIMHSSQLASYRQPQFLNSAAKIYYMLIDSEYKTRLLTIDWRI